MVNNSLSAVDVIIIGVGLGVRVGVGFGFRVGVGVTVGEGIGVGVGEGIGVTVGIILSPKTSALFIAAAKADALNINRAANKMSIKPALLTYMDVYYHISLYEVLIG